MDGVTTTPRADLRRLGLLRQAVERQPAELFYMGSYGVVRECGTAYCAAGCYVGQNPGEGLSLVFDEFGSAGIERAGGIECDAWDLAEHFGVDDSDAGAMFFGRFPGAGRQLFKVSKAQVLEQIDKVIAKYEGQAADEGAVAAPA